MSEDVSIPWTGDSLPLAVAVRPEDGEITNVGPYKHTVRWRDSGDSLCTYCNNCGSPFSLSGSLAVGPDAGRACTICAQCRMFQGWRA